jgi:hypothetical protein
MGSLFSNFNNNNNNQEPQKIYDVIPETSNYLPNCHNNNNNNNNISNAPPPPPPLPNGFFTNPPVASGPPPPPPIMTQPSINNINNNNNKTNNNNNTNNYTNEIGKFQINKLKKVADDQISNNRATVPPQLDFLTEIRQKLEKKNSQQMSASESNSSEQVVDTSGSYKPSQFLRKNNVQNGGTCSSSSNGGAATAKLQHSGNSLNHIDSPKTIKKLIKQDSNVTNGHDTNQQNGNVNNYDKLKQELLTEFRKELQTFKADIISSILGELRLKS